MSADNIEDEFHNVDDLVRIKKLKAERDAALAECAEQARLNGMGAEREARLMAERDAIRDVMEKAIAQMECVRRNLHKGMSKSIQKMQGYALWQELTDWKATLAEVKHED